MYIPDCDIISWLKKKILELDKYVKFIKDPLKIHLTHKCQVFHHGSVKVCLRIRKTNCDSSQTNQGIIYLMSHAGHFL